MSSPQLETPMAEDSIGPTGQPAINSYDAKLPKGKKSITTVEYGAFQRAYDSFNVQLYDKSPLPHVMVTLQRRARSGGYFSPDRFSERTAHGRAHELALNPDAFTGRSDEWILSVLVHEMTHVWQQVYGKPGRGRYHNREWAEKMKEIGLYPSDTGERGGKETGPRMAHYILPAGPYAAAYAQLQKSGFKLHWQSTPPTKERERSKRSKTKFTCLECGQNAWAKPDAKLGCYACGEEWEDGRDAPVLMEPEAKR